MLLTVAAAVWGLGFIIGKGAIENVGATWFSAIRFLGSAIVILVALFPHIYRNFSVGVLKAGCIIGVFSFLGFLTQFIGLGLTTPSKNAFLSACYCLTVPFVWWVVSRKRPSKRVLVAAVVCTVGIAFVSLSDSLSISLGDGISILSAFLYGAEIVVISLVVKNYDILSVTMVQQFVSGFLALAAAFVAQPIPTAAQVCNLEFVGQMLYIVLLAAAFGAVAQNLAQARLSAAESGLLCSLESVFCAVFSAMLLGEQMTPQMILGFVLIFGAIVVTQTDTDSSDNPGKA